MLRTTVGAVVIAGGAGIAAGQARSPSETDDLREGRGIGLVRAAAPNGVLHQEHGLERVDPTGVATHLGATLGPDGSS
jgi:hypothetical protein